MASAPSSGMALNLSPDMDKRAELFARLVTRNRMVAALRILVPALGAAIVLSLIIQIWLSGLEREYGVAGIRIDRGTLVVETPQYSAMGVGGARYVLTAREARTPLGNTDEITMIKALLHLSRPGRATLVVTAEEAEMNTSAQAVDVAGTARLRSDDGMHGTLDAIHSDLDSGVTTASGPVDLTLGDGTIIRAANMRNEGSNWTFGQATVIVPDLPGAEAP